MPSIVRCNLANRTSEVSSHHCVSLDCMFSMIQLPKFLFDFMSYNKWNNNNKPRSLSTMRRTQWYNENRMTEIQTKRESSNRWCLWVWYLTRSHHIQTRWVWWLILTYYSFYSSDRIKQKTSNVLWMLHICQSTDLLIGQLTIVQTKIHRSHRWRDLECTRSTRFDMSTTHPIPMGYNFPMSHTEDHWCLACQSSQCSERSPLADRWWRFEHRCSRHTEQPRVSMC